MRTRRTDRREHRQVGLGSPLGQGGQLSSSSKGSFSSARQAMSLMTVGEQSASRSPALATRVLFLDFDGALQTPALADWVEMKLCDELDRLVAVVPRVRRLMPRSKMSVRPKAVAAGECLAWALVDRALADLLCARAQKGLSLSGVHKPDTAGVDDWH